MLVSPPSHLILTLCNPVKLREKESGEALPERRSSGNKINIVFFVISDLVSISD
jgi:hypothetical protein